MKSVFALLYCLCVVLTANSQIQEITSTPHSQKHNLDNSAKINNFSRGIPVSVAALDTIWSDDFSDTLNWQHGNNDNEWNISTSLTSNLILQNFDTKLQSTSGGNFAIIDSDGAGNSGIQNAILEYTGGNIDCSAYPNVRLVFQTYLKQFMEEREVLISSDSGATWDSIPVLTQFGTSVTSPNAYTEMIDISNWAGGKASVQIKFRYVGAYDWFWCIDDVSMVATPQHDLQLNQEFYNGTSNFSYATYYNMIPLKQAQVTALNFGATYSNVGVADQTNTHVLVYAEFDGDSIYNHTSDSSLAMSGNTYSSDLMNALPLSHGLGQYDIEFSVLSDSTDEWRENNKIHSAFEVTWNQYRRDNDTINSDNWFDASNSWEMLVRYEIFATDTVVAISAFFPSSIGGRGVKAGDSISYYLYRASDLSVPITSYEWYYIQSSDENNWVTLPMPEVKLDPGVYYAGFKLNNNNSSVGTNSEINQTTPYLGVLVRIDKVMDSDPWQFTTAFTPFVRMYSKTDSACAGVDFNVTHEVIDSTTYGAVILNVSGSGAAPFEYAWEGPDDFTADTKNISNLDKQGNYAVTITDALGCEEWYTFEVEGSVNVAELSIHSGLEIYPNPNHGYLTINHPNLAKGIYSISIKNILGQEVFAKKVSHRKMLGITLDISHLPKGVFLISIHGKQSLLWSSKLIKE